MTSCSVHAANISALDAVLCSSVQSYLAPSQRGALQVSKKHVQCLQNLIQVLLITHRQTKPSPSQCCSVFSSAFIELLLLLVCSLMHGDVIVGRRPSSWPRVHSGSPSSKGCLELYYA
eukprot:3733337-Amphidinium_carterae.1